MTDTPFVLRELPLTLAVRDVNLIMDALENLADDQVMSMQGSEDEAVMETAQFVGHIHVLRNKIHTALHAYIEEHAPPPGEDHPHAE